MWKDLNHKDVNPDLYVWSPLLLYTLISNGWFDRLNPSEKYLHFIDGDFTLIREIKQRTEIHLLILLSWEFLNIAEDCGRQSTSEQWALSHQETDFFFF